MKKVSFDFDDTLSFQDIQKYAEELINNGIEVHIVTSRYENLDDYLPVVWPNGHNDLFEVADRLNIKRENIHFTNMQYKINFFIDNPTFIWHLDDNFDEVKLLKRNSKTKGVWALDGNYKYVCDKILNETRYNNGVTGTPQVNP